MSRTLFDLPVKLEELLQFSFNFNNLIKVINYLHQNNISLQENVKDMDKRLRSMESLRNDIEDLKIKTTNIEKTNDNLNRSLTFLQEKVLKYDTKITDIQTKTNDIESQIKKYESVQIEHEQNLNHLNKVVEDNVKECNKFNEIINISNQNITKITEKMSENEKNNKENYENVNKNITDINLNYEIEHKEIENINNNIGEINATIKNITNNFEKKNSDLNSRILNIINDIAEINNNMVNNTIKNKKNNKLGKEVNISVINPVSNDINSSNLFKIAMDEIEEGKNKFNKLKEDYELFKEKQEKENINYKNDINKINKDCNNLNKINVKNTENIENLENYLNDYINLQKEENEKREEKESYNKEEDIDEIANLSTKYVKVETFKKVSDKVRILTSTMNSKPSREEIETQLKKLNTRLENVEMITQGQTHGPRTRINLGLVNLPYNKTDSIQSNSEEGSELNEIDYLAKIIEKKINKNIFNIINKEIKNIDFTLHPKINELFKNYHKNCEDIDKNNKTIIDIRNILLSNPTQNDFKKIKSDIEQLEDVCKTNKVKILELIKDIKGSGEDEEEEEESQNNLTGSIKDKINILNKTCQSLNLKLVSLDNKHKSITKEVKDDIKQNLKNETAKIMQQFKARLESFTNKFEHELNNKIDQIGLSNFENKINNKFHIDLKEKLDKNELKKNNNLIKRKIDSLENKISKTLVDTIIDLQMDDQPLIIKKNGNGVDVCASCNQPFSRNNNIYGSGEFLSANISNSNASKIRNSNRNLLNFTQPSNMKSNNNSERSLTNANIGNSKLPDIIPFIHPK